ncbi:MAG: hypothetical protein KDB68_16050, partial [Planctomycetes bacterium]|nr:hypothetical protein [Planctomycetota bacterium]
MRYLLAALLLATFVPVAYAADTYRGSSPQLLADTDVEDEELDGGLPDAEMALDVGRYSSAKIEFKKVVKADPTNQLAARGLAETYSRIGDYKLGIRALEKCLEALEADKKPEPRTLVVLARLQLTTGDLTAAGKLAD